MNDTQNIPPHLRRRLQTFSERAQSHQLDQGSLIDFSSNDYLGLSREPALVEVFKQAAQMQGVGAGAARLLSGTRPAHTRLEKEIAQFKQTEAALTFTSGYATAVGCIPALFGPQDVIILDKLSHACLIDGARLSRAHLRVFPHNHLGRLESHLRWAKTEHPDGRILVVTESIFSMDGDACPLKSICAVTSEFGAWLLLDEAHAVGVLGPQGRGLAALHQVSAKVDLHMGTLSKAIGVAGGYLATSQEIVERLLHRARSFVFSTAPPPALAEVGLAALQLVQGELGEARRKQLHRYVTEVRKSLPKSLLPHSSVEAAILPLPMGEETRALEWSARLRELGYFLPAIRYPTVAKGEARLRLTLSATHRQEDISGLLSALQNLACS
ncbi:MAG: aminotransferase class I/II-fold pyridoxal phosphate-dependent enzyme [Verrucomicrobiales bacterium]